jgi:hypothetical protein
VTPVIEQSPSREIEEVTEDPVHLLEGCGATEEQLRTGNELAWPFFI